MTTPMANEATCKMKMVSYCKEWYAHGFGERPYDWNKEAEGCVKIGYHEPTKGDCEDLINALLRR